MITIDTDPILNPINIGAKILNIMENHDSNKFHIEELFENISGELNISYDVFTYTLDWLYIIEAIDIDEVGVLIYASK
ncbi:ABC-three component system middle component 6 [Photobacterium leiognathi subsp. mandapamensis]